MPKLITDPNDLKFSQRDEVMYMLGNPPSWLTRYGIMAVTLFLVVMLALSYLIKYPDIVTCRVIITTENPPIRILSKTGGRVSDILVKNNETVIAGQLLAVMENTADWHDVLKLEKQLDNTGSRAEASHARTENLKLGAIQNIYSAYTQNLKDYIYFQKSTGVADKINHLEQQIESLKQLNDNLLRQKDIQTREFELSKKELARQKQLNSEGVISDSDFEKFNAGFLQQQRQIQAGESGFFTNEMLIKQNAAQISDLKQGKSDNGNTKELTLMEDTRRLKTGITEWKQTNIIFAPIAGKVSMSKIWSVQQTVNVGEEIFAVIPENAKGGNKIVKATLPVANSGKVKIGLKSNMRVDAYPYQQYGMLEGRVKNISLLPQTNKDGDTYLIELSIDNDLKTNYGKVLPLKQEMQGNANIITEDRRVVSRLFDRLNDLMKNEK